MNRIKENNGITVEQLATLLGISKRKLEREMAFLKETNAIKYIGLKKTGHWEVIV